jgi:ADP-dependent NAD(P)H-hydrate dehydratase
VKTVKYTKALLTQDLPMRKKHDSKVQGGKVGIIAGSPGMWGAALLAGQAASRAGAGYVYMLESSQRNLFKHPDFLVNTTLQLKKQKLSAVVLGPGYKNSKSIGQWIRHWVKERQSNVILDAEALTWLALHPGQTLLRSWVLTPHEGEMARLLGKSRLWVHRHRAEAVQRAQRKWRCVVVLKGATTLVADQEHVFKVAAGNPSLGKAGSGDVLAGMIAAFLAQNLSVDSITRAVCAATFVHGWLADQWIRSNKDVLSLRPTDLLEELPFALATLRKDSRR